VERLGILMAAAVVRAADRVLVHSEHAADLIEWDTGIRPDVVYELPVPDLGNVDRRPEPGLLVSLGVLSPAKFTGMLVEALPALPDARLALVGPVDDPYRQELHRLASEFDVADRVTITGRVEPDEYFDWLRRAQVVVQLRAYSNGESSGSVAEALSVGVPIVVSDVGTFRDLPDAVVRRVAPDPGVDDIASAISHLLSDERLRTAMSTAARSYSEEHTYESAARRLIQVLFA
jgi:glycosyltransferase involved in cell wall biosynthesis